MFFISQHKNTLKADKKEAVKNNMVYVIEHAKMYYTDITNVIIICMLIAL